MKLCIYKCGQKAQYQFKNGKWCCSEFASQCPTIKKKTSRDLTGSNNPMFGRKHSSETIEKYKKDRKGRTPWNKGIPHTQETKEKMSKSGKGRISHRKGKKLSPEHIEKMKGKIPWNKETPIKESTKHKLRNRNLGKKLSNQTKEKIKNSLLDKYKNSYTHRNIPRYDIYAHKLTIEENPKRHYDDSQILTVICTHCKTRFIPKLNSVQERVRCLNNEGGAESRLYCSDSCKNNCSVYGKSLYQEGHPKNNIINYNQEEYQQFRGHVLERDSYICQYCGEKAEHVHHERPQKLEPFFALDPDLAWSVCIKCHYKYGHRGDCSTGKLSSMICSN